MSSGFPFERWSTIGTWRSSWSSATVWSEWTSPRGVHLHLGVERLPRLDRPQLVAVGMQPRDGLALDAGLRVDAGVLVDATGQTSAAGVYAAGDVARYFSPTFGTNVRVEHFQTA